jgi:hypothetical protein
MRRAIWLVSMTLAASPALALADDLPKGPHAEGEYGGVEPGQPKKPEPGKKSKKPPPKGTLSWIGFEAKDGSSDVFFQSPAPFEVLQRIENGTLVVTLSHISRLGQNTWRPIDTRFFATPVARVSAKKKGSTVEVRITFKNPKEAVQGSVRTATEADGMYYVHLGFGGGAASEPEPDKNSPEK